MASLTVIQGLDRGKTFEVEETDFVIGREPSCEIPLSDTSVSRHHARMVQTGKQLRIKDLGGVNGTFVNGARIADTAVEPGDQIRVGNTLLRLESTATAGLPDEDGGVIVDTEGNLVDSSIKATVRPEEAPHQVFAPGSGDVAEIRTALVGLQAIYKISDTIGSIRDVRELLKQIMDMVFDVVDADRGFIMITDEETGQMVPMAIRYREELIEEIQREQSGGDAKGTGGGKDQKSLPITVSHTIINYVMKRGEGVLSTNAMQDRRFADGESVHDFGIRSALCVPLKAHDRILGIIHVDMHISQGQFTEDDLRLMTAMGFQAGLAIENAHLMQATVEAERLAATGQAVASVSHYIKNILQGIQGGEHLLQTGLGAENLHKVEQGWEIIRRNQDRINNLVKNMLNFSRNVEPNLQKTNVNAIMREVVELVRERAQEKNVRIETDLDTHLPEIMIDPDGIHHACLNILANAVDAVEPINGQIIVATRPGTKRRETVIEIKDNGPGIPRRQQKNIFTPFHSTKGHKGSGLGLAVAEKIVREHGGRITLRSEPAQGATFTIKLPNKPKAKTV